MLCVCSLTSRNSALPAEGTESTDIRAVAKPTAPSRPRGTGKLLSNVNGIGLALLRLEHLEGVQAGHLDLELGSKGAGRKIVHWWPDWWPHRPDSHPEESE
jgi:transferase CAF17, mitochondrial